jgi:hypothetical protein
MGDRSGGNRRYRHTSDFNGLFGTGGTGGNRRMYRRLKPVASDFNGLLGTGGTGARAPLTAACRSTMA